MKITSKYRNRRTVSPDGQMFDSQAEYRRYQDLLLLERAGEIRSLKRQVIYKFEVSGIIVCRYIADFVYEERSSSLPEVWSPIIEDVKSEATRKKESYRTKARWMAALGTPIREYVVRSRR